MQILSRLADKQRHLKLDEALPQRSGTGLGQLLMVGACALTLSACVSAKEQRAIDQNKCAGFGFELGTDAFAQCMMETTQHREELRQNERLAQQARISAENRENDRRRDYYRALSLQRAGDKNFPVCGAGSGGGIDVPSGTWSGPNCRAK